MLVSMYLDSVKAASTDLIHKSMMALLGYQTAAEEIEKTATMRIDREEYTAEHQAEAKAKAAHEISEAQAAFSKTVRHEIGNLRNELSITAMDYPPAHFEKLVNAYLTYGIQPTKTEIQYLLDYNNGCRLGLQILNVMLEKTGTPYRIAFTPFEAYDEDLQRLADIADHPDGCPQELSQLYLDVMPSDNLVSPIMRLGAFRRTIDKLPEMTERWKSAAKPVISDFRTVTLPSGEKLSPEAQLENAQKDREHGNIKPHASLGAALGQQKADAMKTAQAALEAHKG